MSDNNSDSSLTYQQETTQDLLCLCTIVLIVGAILIVAYLQDTEKKILKVVVGGVLITMGAIPGLVLCICLQKMSSEEAEMHQLETMYNIRALESINRLDGTMSLHRFHNRMTLSRLDSIDQEGPPSDTEDSVRANREVSTQTPPLVVPSITVTVAPAEESEPDTDSQVDDTELETANPSHFLTIDGHSDTVRRPLRRGSLFESVAEVMEALQITR